MFQEVKHSLIKPRIVAVSATCASSAISSTQSGETEVTLASSGTGLITATYRRGFNKGPIVGACASWNDIAAGGFISASSGNSQTSTLLAARNTSAASDDGTISSIAIGWDSEDISAALPDSQFLTSERRKGCLLGFVASQTGITVGSGYGTLVQNGTGDFTITFKRSFGNSKVSCSVNPTGLSTTGATAMAVVSATNIRVKCFDASGAATNIACSILVFGSFDSTGEAARQGDPVVTGMRKPRIVAGRITYTSGVPAITLGGGDFTIADTGTGICTVTLKNKFSRAPIVVGMGSDASSVRYLATGTLASASFDLRAFNGAALGDPGNASWLDFIALGSDDPSEYGVVGS